MTVPSARGFEGIRDILSMLDPGIGIAMSMNDAIVQMRGKWKMAFEQPWMILSEAGELFRETVELARSQNRIVMGIHEFSQSEVFDPAC